MMRKKNCLVIGGNSGIGLEFVKYLVKSESQIIIASSFNSTTEDKLKNILMGRQNIFFYRIDITNDAEIENLSKFTSEKFRYLDILINSSGLGFYKRFENTSVVEIDKIVDTNLTAPIKLFNMFLPIMNSTTQSFIVQLGSYAGKEKGHELLSVYSAAKSGLLGFFNSIVPEYSRSNIKFYLIYLPGVKTNFFSKAIGGKEFKQKAKSSKLQTASKVVKEIFDNMISCASTNKYILYIR